MKRIYFAAAIAALTLSACSTKEATPPRVPDEANLSFKSVLTAQLVSRAVTPLAAPFSFNLAEKDGFAAMNNQRVAFDNGAYTPPQTITIYKMSPRTMTAWAPADISPDGSAANLFALTPGNVDFVYKREELTTANCTNLALTMDHAMAKVEFVVEFPADYSGDEVMNTLTLKGTPNGGKFDILTGTWSENTTIADLPVVTADHNLATNPMVYAVPVGTGVMLDCKINGAEYPNVAIGGITKLDKGNAYTITLTVSGASLAVTGVDKGEWGPGEAGSGTIK